MFQAAADALSSKDHHAQALRFYEPLVHVEDYLDNDMYARMATCYQNAGRLEEAENMFKIILENDETSVNARVQLAKISEALGKPEQAFMYVNEIISMERKAATARAPKRRRATPEPPASTTIDPTVPSRPRARSTTRRPCPSTRPRSNPPTMDRAQAKRLKDDATRRQFLRAQALEEQAQQGNNEAAAEWTEATLDLLEDFRSAKVFYPTDRYTKFLGYAKEGRAGPANEEGEVIAGMEAMGERPQASLRMTHCACPQIRC